MVKESTQSIKILDADWNRAKHLAKSYVPETGRQGLLKMLITKGLDGVENEQADRDAAESQ